MLERKRLVAASVGAAVITSSLLAAAAAEASPGSTFYLKAEPGHCYVISSTAAKQFRNADCGDPSHNLEVFWKGKAGNVNQTTKQRVKIAIRTCKAKARDNSVAGRVSYFIADPGKELRKFKTTVVCAQSV